VPVVPGLGSLRPRRRQRARGLLGLLLAVGVLAVLAAQLDLQPQPGLGQQRRPHALGQPADLAFAHHEVQGAGLVVALALGVLDAAGGVQRLVEQLALGVGDAALADQHGGGLADAADHRRQPQLALLELADQRDQLGGQDGGAVVVFVVVALATLGVLGGFLLGFGGGVQRGLVAFLGQVEQRVELVLGQPEGLVAELLLALGQRRDHLLDLVGDVGQGLGPLVGLVVAGLVERRERLDQRLVVQLQLVLLDEAGPVVLVELVCHRGILHANSAAGAGRRARASTTVTAN
jgi:hypothetical protein